jgi:hypothetical protein
VNALRIGIVLAALVTVLASASGPSKHAVQPTMAIAESSEDAWAALLEVFAEKRWATKSVHEKSGLLTTDWIELGYDGDKYADCGSVKTPVALPTTKPSTQVTLEIRVTRTATGSTVTVGSVFRRPRSDGTGFIDCTSRGSIETTIHNEVAARANKRAMVEEPVPTPRGFYCAAGATVSICTRRQVDCDSARGAIVAAVPDVTPCAPAEAAWCFDAGSGERCSATSEACAAQRASAGSAAPECVEAH